MKNCLVKARNFIIRKLYKWVLKPIFFKFDPEAVHDCAISIGKFLGKFYITKKITGLFFRYSDSMLRQNILDINFENPVGLSAGFDKNAVLTDILPEVGFGFMEVGSITGEGCGGNPRPRLWRLKKTKSLVVYSGLNNEGCEVIAKRLRGKKFRIPLIISIAKTNSPDMVDMDKGVKDYLKAYNSFSHLGDFITINISCPNTFGGQPFTDSKKLNVLLEKITSVPKVKPIFLKLPPDLKEREIDEIIDLADKFKIDGFICSNLIKDRGNPKIKEKIKDKNIPEKGGISGKVTEDLANDLIRYIYKKTNSQVKGQATKFVIIGVGGIFSAEDAYKKIKAGASLLELITSMIYEGPQVISEINLGLVKLLKKDGYKNISEAIGKE
jgi:dihydroorotate dehydrogenase